MKKWINSWNQYWFAVCPLHGLALFRILLGTIFFLYYWIRLSYVTEMFSNKSFFYPLYFFEKLPLFSPFYARLIVVGALLCSVCFALGFLTRFFNLALLLFSLYLGGLESATAPGCFNLMWISLFLLLFSPAGRFGSVDYLIWKRRNLSNKEAESRGFGTVWVQRLIVIQLAEVYFSSAFYKLSEGGPWYSGENLGKIFMASCFGKTPLGLWFVDHPWTLVIGGTGSVLLEFFLPVLLLTPQFRYFGITLGILFHSMIFLTMNLSGFFFLVMVSHYSLVIPPEDCKRLFEKVKSYIHVIARRPKADEAIS